MSRSVYARQQLSRRIGAAAAAELTTMDVVRTRSMLDMPRPHQRMEDHKAEYRAQQSPWKDPQAVQAAWATPPQPETLHESRPRGLPVPPLEYRPTHAGYPGTEPDGAPVRRHRLEVLRRAQDSLSAGAPYLCDALRRMREEATHSHRALDWLEQHIRNELNGCSTLTMRWRETGRFPGHMLSSWTGRLAARQRWLGELEEFA